MWLPCQAWGAKGWGHPVTEQRAELDLLPEVKEFGCYRVLEVSHIVNVEKFKRHLKLDWGKGK